MANPVLDRLAAIPRVPLLHAPSPVEELVQLREALGGGPRLFVKRDDAIPFGFGGNKVRKLEFVLAEAMAAGADTLVTLGGVQSNHARATASAAAKLGLQCVLIANGVRQDKPTGNALLDALLGAQVEYIATRADRAAASRDVMARLRDAGRKPFLVPLGASTPSGAIGFARAIGELLQQGPVPDFIIHTTSSGGTQAGLVAGVALNNLKTRVLGVSADDPARELESTVRSIVAGMGPLLDTDGDALASACSISVDDGHIGEGYGIPTTASREAQQLAAHREALFVDDTYTSKSLGALIGYVRQGRFRDNDTVLFWHTGGQVGLFA